MGVPTSPETKNDTKQAKGSRLRRKLPVAIPALAGVAVAGILSSQALASPAAQARPLPQKAHQAVVVHKTATTHAKVKAAAKTVSKTTKVKTESKAQPKKAAHTYTVRSGDTLSGIADGYYDNPSAWPTIYAANHGKVHNANLITPGEVLNIPGKAGHIAAAPAAPAAPADSAAPVAYHATQAHKVHQLHKAHKAHRVHEVTFKAAPEQTVIHHHHSTHHNSYSSSAVSSGYTGGTPGGSFGKCVVQRESGGNPNVMNSSGHYGLYQFSASTWARYGGSPSSFGHASVGQQNQVFSNALAQGGQFNWSPYDGC